MAFRSQSHCTRPHLACVPLPSLSAQPPILDPILRSRSMMTWSVCEHPSTALANMALPYGEVWQDRPATSPRISSLTIWSGPTKGRPIVIIGEPFVTIGDVLRHVYVAIRAAAREYYQPTARSLLPQPHALQQVPDIDERQMRRSLLLQPHALQQVPGIDERQMRRWVLYYLQGHNTWKGLRFYDSDSWWLDVWRWS